MQKEGKPQFIQAHSGIVQGVAFNPKERYTFCSGATDGKINIYNALQGRPTMSARMTSPNAIKNINAVKYNADGSRILTTTAKRLSVLDAERGVLVCNYENCAYAGKERAPLASDPHDPNLAVCACTNGKGLVFFDLRKQQPIRFSLGTHSSVIRDIIYLDDSWPFGSQTTFVSVSLDGICKIRTLDDKQLHCMDVKHRSNCLAATSDNYSMLDDHGLKSLMMIGGDNLTGYLAGTDQRLITFSPCERPIQKLRYTSNGHFLFTASSEGQVSRYRAIDEDLQFINHLYSHKDDIIDMDISPTDEFIVTSSRDGTVGLQCLGVPSYGWTGFMQLA